MNSMKNKFQRFGWLLLSNSLALLVLPGCNKPGGAGDSEIRVGEFASLTGKEATFGQMSHHGTELAIEEINAGGGVLGNYIFRVCFTDAFQGKLLANFAKRSLKASNVAILTDTKSDYSVGLSRDFRTPFLASNGKVVAEQVY